MKKYEITDETKTLSKGTVLHRIHALLDIPKSNINAGDFGGWIEGVHNLSQDGDAWVFGNAQVYGNAKVSGNAKVYGDAEVYGNAEVSGDALVKSSEDYCVYKNTWSSFRWFTYTRSNKMWSVGCFHGTGAELIAKAYKDSEKSGKCYEAIVKAQEAIEKEMEV